MEKGSLIFTKDNMAKKQTKVAVAAPVSNQRIELWVYDEFNQGAIVQSGNDVTKLIEKAEQYVTDTNVNNALAGGELEKTWEAHLPVFLKKGKLDNTRFYAGNKRDGKHYVYTQVDGKWKQSELAPTDDLRFFLGKVKVANKDTSWYLSDHKGNEIKSFSNNNLERKTVLFLKFV